MAGLLSLPTGLIKLNEAPPRGCLHSTVMMMMTGLVLRLVMMTGLVLRLVMLTVLMAVVLQMILMLMMINIYLSM